MSDFDLEAAAAVLSGLGYDVVVGDGEVSARRDDVAGVWMVYLDRDGRMRFVATRLGAIPRGKRVKADGRTFRLLRETQETITVMTELDCPEKIPEALERIARWIEEFPEGESGGGRA